MSNRFVHFIQRIAIRSLFPRREVKFCRYVIPGLGLKLLDSALERGDLVREISEGPGLASGRRAMGDHWTVEEIR